MYEIKFNLDDKWPLNTTIETSSMIIVVRAVSHEKSKYYPQAFLDEYLYKLWIIWKCYIMIELTFLKELMLIKQEHQKSVILLTISISSIKVLRFNQMSVRDATIY